MPGKFCVSLTQAGGDPDRASVAFVVANAAVGSDQETVVFLSTEGVRLAVQGAADEIREEGFAPLQDLMASFAAAGGTIYVCSPCFKKRGLDETRLVAGARIVGGAKLVEFLASGSPCISY
ncbi:MAG: DsrE family protein [Deltaproteobacteria bacterium]|nr:DsrE family protein [Deltaproteobacteria bacterium]